MKTVTYTSRQLLACAKCNGEVILCVSEALTASNKPFMDAYVSNYTDTWNSCGQAQYVYGFTYDEFLLSDPSYDLTENDIDGMFCRGCLTTYIDAVATVPENCAGICCVGTESEFTAALANDECKQIIINDSFSITGIISVTKPTTILRNSIIHLDMKGTYLEFYELLTAGTYQIFSIEIYGPQVYFTKGSALAVYPEWFGAVGDGVTDDSDAFYDAIFSTVNGNYSHVPVRLLAGKVYYASYMEVYDGLDIGSDVNVNNSAPYVDDPGYSMTSAQPVIMSDSDYPIFSMFMFSTQGVNIHGIQFDGMGSLDVIISLYGGLNINISDCGFRNASIGVDYLGSTGDPNTLLRVTRNNFSELDVGIKFSDSIPMTDASVLIEDNIFFGAMTFGIFCLDVNDVFLNNVQILNNYFNTTSTTNNILMQVATGYQGLAAVIEGNRFDGVPSASCITVGQAGLGTYRIENNQFWSTAPYHIIIEGNGCQINGNFLADAATAGIKVNSGSVNTYIGFQTWGTGTYVCTAEIVDAGTNTRIERIVSKNTTINRPTLLACDIGKLYLDTTLDADGLPIWWNGLKWIKYDGSDA